VAVLLLATVTAGMAASAGRRPTAAARRWRRHVLPAQLAAIVLVALALPVTLAGDGPAGRALAVALAVVAAVTLALAARALRAGRRHRQGSQSTSTVPPERQ
jgi:hypothetical protein